MDALQKGIVDKRRKKKRKSFTEALKEKYCVEEESTYSFINIISPKRKNSSAELDHLKTVVLNDMGVTKADIPRSGLVALCPNVVDLDLASNQLEQWSELVLIFSHLPLLKYVNVSYNQLRLNSNDVIPDLQLTVENLVLNYTGVKVEEVISLSHIMPKLKELHLCGNDYSTIPEIKEYIEKGSLESLECLRLNNNKIQSWSEVWKLHCLPELQCLILSGNPVDHIFYHDPCAEDNANQYRDMDTNSDNILKESYLQDLSLLDDDKEEYPIIKPENCNVKEDSGDSSNVHENINADSDFKKLEDGGDSLVVTTSSLDEENSSISESCLEEYFPDEKETQLLLDDILLEDLDFDVRPVSRIGRHSESECSDCYTTDSETSPENSTKDKFITESGHRHNSTESNCDKTSISNKEKNENNNKKRFDQPEEDFSFEVEAEFIPINEINENIADANYDASIQLNDEEFSVMAEAFLYDIISQIDFESINDVPVQTTSFQAPPTSQTHENSINQSNLIPSQNVNESNSVPDSENFQDNQDASRISDNQNERGSNSELNQNQNAQMTQDGSNSTCKCLQSQNNCFDKSSNSLQNSTQRKLFPDNLTETSEIKSNSCSCPQTNSQLKSGKTRLPFGKLQMLCLSSSNLNHWRPLKALSQFPCLSNVRLQNNPLYSSVGTEDRRKLYIASLPKVTLLNGSEVSGTEREKAERHYLRHFRNIEEKPDFYSSLVAKHGVPVELVDINLSAGYQEFADLNFVANGRLSFTKRVCLKDPVARLRPMIASKLNIPKHAFVMYHKQCGDAHPEAERDFQELRCESLPMSRFDFADDDEIHIDISGDAEQHFFFNERSKIGNSFTVTNRH